MARRDLKTEFNSYKNISKDNVEVFDLLIEQTNQLDKLIDNSNAEEAEELKLIKGNLDKGIVRLIDNSGQLFTKYKKIITQYSEVA